MLPKQNRSKALRTRELNRFPGKTRVGQRRRLLLESLESRRVLATIMVTSSLDGSLADLAGDGEISLREAIAAANSDSAVNEAPAGSGPDTIEFSSELIGSTILLSDGELLITDDLIINGLGSEQLTIDGNASSRIFNITDGDNASFFQVQLSDLTLTNGRTVRDTSINDSGFGGAIFSRENLNIHRSEITDSIADSDGGGIAFRGDSLEIVDTIVSGNRSSFVGGIDIHRGEAQILRSRIIENTGADGAGGLQGFNGSRISIVDSDISHNFGGAQGAGGILNFGGELRIESSLMTGNYTDGQGGAIYSLNIGSLAPATLYVSNSTIVNNEAGEAGGIYSTDSLSITHSTIIANTSQRNAGVHSEASAFLYSTVVAGNRDADGANELGGVGGFGGAFNIVGDELTSSGLIDGVNGNQIGVDWKQVVANDGTVPTLADNGGSTSTVALLENGPAVDAGDPNAVAGQAGVPEFDQRGQPRIRDRIDIGAVEFGFIDPEVIWEMPDSIIFGTALGAEQLDATAIVSGTFEYTPTAGEILSAGNDQILMVTFTPDDNNYRSVTAETTISVEKATPEIEWATPDSILFLTELSATQLNATADVPGTFIYTPDIGTVLEVGTAQLLTVAFTPDDSANYEASSAEVFIDVLPSLDFGDAPSAALSGFVASYPTLLADDGARHVAGDLYLGATVDVEADGVPSIDLLGDDLLETNDEEGIRFVAPLLSTSGDSASSVEVTASAAAKLDAWIDFNRDGDWDDEGEQIFTSIDVTAGSQTLSFTVPGGSLIGTTAGRFRLSRAGSLAPTGLATDGEVEDYEVEIKDASAGIAARISPRSGAPVQLSVQDGFAVAIQDGVELFRAPRSSLSSVFINGTDEDDVLTFSEVGELAALLGGDGGLGFDILEINEAGFTLDLTALPNEQIQGIERIVLTGLGANNLVLNQGEVLDISTSTDVLEIVHDNDDQLVLGSGWDTQTPTLESGEIIHRLVQGDAVLRIINDRPWANPNEQVDVTGDEEITARDALLIINRINEGGSGPLADPTAEDLGVTFGYVDTSRDGQITPLDVLLVINFINERGAGEGEGEGLLASVNNSSQAHLSAADVNERLTPFDWSRYAFGADITDSIAASDAASQEIPLPSLLLPTVSRSTFNSLPQGGVAQQILDLPKPTEALSTATGRTTDSGDLQSLSEGHTEGFPASNLDALDQVFGSAAW